MVIAVRISQRDCGKKFARYCVRHSPYRASALALFSLGFLLWGFPVLAQTDPSVSGERPLDEQSAPAQQLPGSISGADVDPSGAAVAGAQVKIANGDPSSSREVISGDEGRFSFSNIVPGPFQITITSEGFATQVFSGVLHSGENYVAPQIVLQLASRSHRDQRRAPARRSGGGPGQGRGEAAGSWRCP